MDSSNTGPAARCVRATMNYAVNTGDKRRFHANDHSLDTVVLDPREISVVDARTLAIEPTLDKEGGQLFLLPTSVTNFRDDAGVAHVYGTEIRDFVLELTAADEVVVTGPAILRFSERSHEAGTRNNSDAARLIHSDASASAAASFIEQNNPHPARKLLRAAQHNIWRAFSGPPQDMPLALCDARSVAADDIIFADAAFDQDGQVTWSFEALLFQFNAAHRWYYYSNMTADEVLVFKRHDTQADLPQFVPHSAFTDLSTPAGTHPRASAEMRTIAYWYD